MRTIIFFLIVFILIITLGSYVWYHLSLRPASSTPSSQTITIPKGVSVTQIAQILSDNQLIRSSLAFRVYLKLHPGQAKLRAGAFKLSPDLSTSEIIRRLTSGGFEGVWVTFLEGWRREQFALELDNSLKTCGEEDSENCFSVSEFLQLTKNQEGHLFPDTYLLPQTAGASAIIKTLTDTFDKKTTPLLPASSTVPGQLSFDEAVVLASILEREAAKSKDYPIIAGILLKRLQQGWPLQADATLQYAKVNNQLTANSYQLSAISDWWPEPLAADKELNSPHNTYKHTGLPSTPISNPGINAIQAVLNPSDSDYWFYITDLQGHMHYAKTLEQHNQNVDRYLR